MKVTKLEHACLVITEGSDTLVVDPGAYTTPVEDLSGVVAVVITHEHADHWTPAQLERVRESSPDVRFFGPAGVVAAATDFPVREVKAGDRIEAGAFRLEFFGGKHAVIHESIPVVDNVGVLVNGTLYYGGDSLIRPEVTIDTLAVPAGAPWLKISEAMDYLAELKPARAFPTHEMGLSVIGRELSNTRLGDVTRAGGGEYFPLEAGESLDL